MKKITLLLVCFLAFAVLAQAQKKPPKKEEPESLEEAMKQLQKEMDADPETKKIMEESGMLDMLKAVEKTTKDADKAMKGMDAASLDPNKIPAKPSGLPIAAAPVSKEQFKAYLQPIMQRTEAAIKPGHKADIAKYLNKGKETGVIAMGYLANNEMDKALYLLLNACITDPEDYASLNNLGALITMSGYAHKSLPILQYVQQKVPQSPTLLNNIGQAWLSLGHLDKAEKFLKDALGKDEKNTEASYSLAVMAKHQGNKTACLSYIKKTIENGGLTGDAYGIITDLDPALDVAELIRPNYKPYYKKDHAVTKRFRAPVVPASYAQAVASYEEVETFFQNLDATANEAQATAGEMTDAYEQQRMKIQQDQMKELTSLVNTPGTANPISVHLKYNHPLHMHALIMLNSMYNSSYSTSFIARMQREEGKRRESDKKLLESLKGIQQQIGEISKQMSKLEGGEGRGDEEIKLEQMAKQICGLRQNYQSQLLQGRAEIANLYMHNMEDLLNQKLQEEIFWLLVRGYPADPTASVYQAYASYLKGIYSFRSLYPFMPELSPPCGTDGPGNLVINGKLQQWEADHCNLNWGFDVVVFRGKMDCSGMKMYADFKVAEVGYGESIDPVTWETTGRSISVEAGKSKEFEVTKNIRGEAGASVKTTVKLDRTGSLSDISVKGSVGASVSGPMGGSAGVELGSAEVSLSGGFNASGPSVNSPGSSFLRD